MDERALLNGVMVYLCFIPVITFHEFAHAWMASKCGDDTARDLGRVSLNPMVHMEFIGTVVLPLVAVFLAASGSGLANFVIGWGRPVPVNINNLKNPRWDDSLIALAGPGMNIILAVIIMAGVKIGVIGAWPMLTEMCVSLVQINLMLCFFNLLPIPPLDGSHVLKNAIGMSFETYWRLCQFGFIIVLVALQLKPVRLALAVATDVSLGLIMRIYGLR